MYFERKDPDIKKGIDIRITDEDVKPHSRCNFCGGVARYRVLDTRPRLPIMNIEVCTSLTCHTKAFSEILQFGYGFSHEGSIIPEPVF